MHIDTHFLELEYLNYDNVKPLIFFFLYVGLKHEKPTFQYEL